MVKFRRIYKLHFRCPQILNVQKKKRVASPDIFLIKISKCLLVLNAILPRLQIYDFYRFLQLALHLADISRRRAPFSVLILYAITKSDSFWNNYGSVRIAQRTRRFIDFVINELITNITNH